MKRTFILAAAAAVTLFAASAAEAARVDWRIGIDVPAIAYAPAPIDEPTIRLCACRRSSFSSLSMLGTAMSFRVGRSVRGRPHIALKRGA